MNLTHSKFTKLSKLKNMLNIGKLKLSADYDIIFSSITKNSESKLMDLNTFFDSL